MFVCLWYRTTENTNSNFSGCLGDSVKADGVSVKYFGLKFEI